MLSKSSNANYIVELCHNSYVKSLNQWKVLCLSLLLLLLSTGIGISQCEIACFDVTVGLGSDCTDTLSLDMLGSDVSTCDGPFIFDLLDANQNSLGTDIIDASMIGQTLFYSITDSSSGNNCWKSIIVEDGGAPAVVTCPPNDTLACYEPINNAIQLLPSDVMDCSSFTITKSDSVLYTDSCGGPFRSEILRTYFVTDIFNNVSTCEQLISFALPTLSDVEFPPNFTADSSLICAPGLDTSAMVTGYPMIDGVPIENGTFCNLTFTVENVTSPSCDGGYKIFRTWSIIDWCNLGEPLDSTQIIEVKDTTPPVLIAPADLTIGVSSTECEGDVVLPAATVSDFCSSTITVQMDGPMGTIFSNGGAVNNLPVGDHVVVYTAIDGCSNEAKDSVIITVEDNIVPIAQCNSNRFIPLGTDGMTTLSASSFDNGSRDQCGPVWFKVKRMDTPNGYSCANTGNPNNRFDDNIKFCCEDIANNNIMVILRIYDRDPGAGPVSDGHLTGRFNVCMIEVEVQDKLDPTIIPPSDLTISCEFPFDPNNLSVFGTVETDPNLRDSICLDDAGNPTQNGLTCIGLDGIAMDNCNVTVSSIPSINIDSCGEGSITRSFTATDNQGRTSSATQRITITNFTPFTLNDITWPQNYETNVCGANLDPDNLPTRFSRPILRDDRCDMVGATYSDEVFNYNLGIQTCYKVLRTWKVVNWCNATVDPMTGATIYPRWEHEQILKVVNTTDPIITSSCEAIEVCSDDDACGPGNVTLTATATDDCTDVSDLAWSYSIDQDNNGSFDAFGSTNNASGLYPIGNHRILWTVEDRCGNKTTCEQLFTVKDCKLPSPYCHDGLSVSLMPIDDDGDQIFDRGMITIWASDFDRGSYHVCGNEVTVSFSEDPADSSRTFTCEDVGINTVQIWAIDEFGNADFCTTHIDIQNNNDIQNCDATDPCEIDIDISSSNIAQGCMPIRAISDASNYSSMAISRTWSILKDDFITDASVGTDYVGFANGTTPNSNPINIGLIPTGAPGGVDGFNDLDATVDEGTVIVKLESNDDQGCSFTTYQTLANITCSGGCDGFGCGDIINPPAGDPRILNVDNPCWLRFSNIYTKTIDSQRWIYFAVSFGALDSIPDNATLTLSKNGSPVYTQTGVGLVTGWHRFTDGPATPGANWSLNVTYTSPLCIKNLSQDFAEPGNMISGLISGQVQNNIEENIQDVAIYLDGANSQPIMTNEEGEFAFPNMPFGGSYSIRPFKDDDHLHGISTYDIVLIQKHLLGLRLLDSPEKIIAADINKSNTITALDLIELRKLILGIDESFINNTSWRFIDSSFEFDDPNNPLAEEFPESYQIPEFINDMLNIDFTGVKIGDVNASIQLGNLNGGTPRNGSQVLEINNQAFKSNEVLEVPFQIQVNQPIEGIQLAIQFDPAVLKFVGVNENDQVNQSNFGLTNTDNGLLYFSWNSSAGNEENPFFKLKFESLTKSDLRESLSLYEQGIKNEIYLSEEFSIEEKQVKLFWKEIGEVRESNNFELLQNRPNPFNQSTTIGFIIPESSEVELSIYDINGKQVWNQKAFYRTGYNEIEVQNNFTLSTGVFYYKLHSDQYSATKRMIIVE